MGVFYGVGVGPGDPELITLKALRIIKECSVIVLPSSPREECRAYNIVKESIPDIDKKDILELPFPMTMSKEELDTFHKGSAEKIKAILNDGKDAAFLTIGDPLLYSTYIYISEILMTEHISCEAVSGISAVFASAAATHTVLAKKDEEVHIIPQVMDCDEALKLTGTRIFMKRKKDFGTMLLKLREHEDDSRIIVRAVSNCGMENETVYYSAKDIPSDVDYLTTIIVKDRNE